MMKRLLLVLLSAVLCTQFLHAAEPPLYSLSAPDQINEVLPNVLLLGDSISIGYTPVVRARLAGVANVYRIRGSEAATVRPKGGLKLDSQAALEHLNDWLGNTKWAVIHFNWGLHDIKIQASGEHQVSIADYERNLRQLVAQLKTTQAKLVWASTTPVPAGAEQGPNARKAGDEIAYNAVAKRIMIENGIPIDDLHALVSPRLSELQRPANVHFNETGSLVLGGQVSTFIETALSQ